MNVKCGINGETLTEQQLFVCHHCGMPVCEEHGWVVTADDAFADSASAPTRLPEGSAPRPTLLAGMSVPTLMAGIPAPIAALLNRSARGSASVPRPAMHCRECADRYHKGAARGHGWFDSAASRS
jgi:hypothetical protein